LKQSCILFTVVEEDKEIDESAILESQLSMAVTVLTSKACSEEGLEDATNLLLQLSQANTATRSSVLDLLLAGAKELGLTVCAHIRLESFFDPCLYYISHVDVKCLRCEKLYKEHKKLYLSYRPYKLFWM